MKSAGVKTKETKWSEDVKYLCQPIINYIVFIVSAKMDIYYLGNKKKWSNWAEGILIHKLFKVASRSDSN